MTDLSDKAIEFARGGWVPGYDGTTDRVPYEFSGPDYVLSKEALKRLSGRILNELNHIRFGRDELDYLWDARD